MGLFKKTKNSDNIERSTPNYHEFWNWFRENEKQFFETVKTGHDIEEQFFDQLSPRLAGVKEGIFFLAGMLDDGRAELVFTADGSVQHIVFTEELVDAAPTLPNWKFTALKQEIDLDSLGIRMDEYNFDRNTLSFYATDHADYPDEVDIVIVHKQFNEENKSTLISGVYIFLDNYLGELNAVTTIDNLQVIGEPDPEKELIPINKLKDFLTWREKEFVEKYEGTRYDTGSDSYSLLEAELENGHRLLAVINSQLLDWDRKASHPWIAVLTIQFDGADRGMPNDADYELLDKIEENIMAVLKDADGYLNIGRQTANSEREIYFACKEFRAPAKVLYTIEKQYANRFKIEWVIYKDKYWQSFERFKPAL